MNCKDVQKLLPLYLKKLIEEPMLSEISSHVENCLNCKKALEFEKEITRGIEELFETEFREIKHDFSTSANTRKANGRKTFTLIKKITLAFAATIILTAGLLFFKQTRNFKSIVVTQPKIETVKISEPLIKDIVFIDGKLKTNVNKLGNNVYLVQIQGGQND